MSFLKSRKGGVCAIVVALILAIIISGNMASTRVTATTGRLPDYSPIYMITNQLTYMTQDTNNIASVAASCADVERLRQARRNLVDLLDADAGAAALAEAADTLYLALNEFSSDADLFLLSEDDRIYVEGRCDAIWSSRALIRSTYAQEYNAQVRGLTEGINNLPYRLFSTLGLVNAPELYE